MIRIIINYFLNIFEDRTFGAVRSSGWSKVRAEHIRKFPYCAVCGGTKVLEIHHKVPFHLRPDLELSPENLITLCEAGTNGIVCHRAIGHLGSYQSFNKDVEKDAKTWKKKLSTRP